jgi:2-phosphosulfolactate phosphatase
VRVDVVLTPAEIDHLPERDLGGVTCVVFDVLRATSSMVTGLAHGVLGLHPVATIEEALALKRAHPEAVLGGERHGERIDGFDVGNSPLEYLELAGRRVITTTTNGTVALKACREADEVLAGALLNLDAIAQHLRARDAQEVLVVCAGTFREMALEDVLAAGALVEALAPARTTDPAETARALHRDSKGDLLGVLRRARNGGVLEGKGRGAEVAWCAQRSLWPVVGVLRDGWVEPHRVEARGA